MSMIPVPVPVDPPDNSWPVYAFQKRTHPHILTELKAAGLPDGIVVRANLEQTTVYIQCPATSFDAAAQVVSLHDAATLEAADAAAAQADGTDKSNAEQAVAQLLSERDLLADSTKSVTAADFRRILLLLVRVTLAVVRVLQRRGVV